MYITVTYKYEVIYSARLIDNTWYDVNPLNSIGNIRQNHWTLNKSQGYGRLHECTAAAAHKGYMLSDQDELSSLKCICQN